MFSAIGKFLGKVVGWLTGSTARKVVRTAGEIAEAAERAQTQLRPVPPPAPSSKKPTSRYD